jgi:murein DD-endopeptidase MepM/ murein hydrolase activator NlpD
MSKWRDFLYKLKQPIKIAASNPVNFEQIWSFSASGVQMVSALIVLILLVGSLFMFLTLNGPFASYFSNSDVPIDRKKLEAQHQELIEISRKLKNQEAYISSMKIILSGKSIKDTLVVVDSKVKPISSAEIDSKTTKSEKELSEEVAKDLQAIANNKNKGSIPYFANPVSGNVSQGFDFVKHPAVDILVSNDTRISACLSGTILFSGFSKKDGNVLVLGHANGYISIYKHAKKLLKKVGSKVQMGDPIALVGNKGENITVPHLHFELWYNLSPVNPEKYMDFLRK